MGQTDPRIDKYIARAADFAKPILTHLRKVVHATCPDVEETMKPKKPLPMPADFAAALKTKPAARKAFDAFSPSHRREYVEWVTEARTDATRQQRMATAVDWLSEGKSRDWKYEPK